MRVVRRFAATEARVPFEWAIAAGAPAPHRRRRTSGRFGLRRVAVVEHGDSRGAELLDEHGVGCVLDLLGREHAGVVANVVRVEHVARVSVRDGTVRPPLVLLGLTSASGPCGARSRIGISAEAHALLYVPTTPMTCGSIASARAFATQRAQSNEPHWVVESSHD
jgi:hypothetical protein